MTIYPAIDLYEGKVVRLRRGDYAQMTVYSNDPLAVARGFRASGARACHIVDLEGARDGISANFEIVKRIVKDLGRRDGAGAISHDAGESLPPFVQVGGGVRTAVTIDEYLRIGVRRVILGTAAVSVPGFLREMVGEFGSAIAVSADIKDGFIAIKGWTTLSDQDAQGFCRAVEATGVQTLICTDVSKDGLLGGTNMELYRTLRERLSIRLIASGGISSLDEIRALSGLGLDGAIVGSALYTGHIDLAEAVEAAQ